MSKPPLITGCIIALNEAAVISRALASLRDAVDEIVVVDGGSTDETVAIAHAAGARVILEPWQNDFAHARNTAVATASHDWILFIDCDETLEPGGAAILRAAAEVGTHEGWLVRVRHTTSGGPSENEMVRFGSRVGGRHFVRRIHEQINPPFGSVGRTNAVVRHWPSPVALREAKHRRNLRLLNFHLAEEPDDLYCRIDRLQARRALRDPEWAADLVGTAALLDWTSPKPPPHQQVHVLLELALIAPAEALPAGWTFVEVTAKAEKWFPRNCVLAGLSCWRLTEASCWQRAVSAGERALHLWRTKSFDTSHPFDPSFLHNQLRATLAHAYDRLGKHRAASAQRQRRVSLLPPEFCPPTTTIPSPS